MAPDVSEPSDESVTDGSVAPVVAVPDPAEKAPSVRYLDPKDLRKNDEVPSPVDGRTKEEMEYGDGICPLLSEEAPAERKMVEVGGHEVTATQPYRVLTDPVECPTCKKQVESSQLTWDVKAGGGERDCAIAIALRDHPVTKEAQAALDEGAYGKAERIADRHPLRERFKRFLGFKLKQGPGE